MKRYSKTFESPSGSSSENDVQSVKIVAVRQQEQFKKLEFVVIRQK